MKDKKKKKKSILHHERLTSFYNQERLRNYFINEVIGLTWLMNLIHKVMNLLRECNFDFYVQ